MLQPSYWEPPSDQSADFSSHTVVPVTPQKVHQPQEESESGSCWWTPSIDHGHRAWTQGVTEQKPALHSPLLLITTRTCWSGHPYGLIQSFSSGMEDFTLLTFNREQTGGSWSAFLPLFPCVTQGRQGVTGHPCAQPHSGEKEERGPSAQPALLFLPFYF